MQKRQRKALAWYLAGFAVIQLGLGIWIDRYSPANRDPDFDELTRIVHERQAAAPGRPLVLVFGSSRTQGNLRAELLNHPANPAAPVVVNCAVLGGGPMMHQVMLRRFLRNGIRPDLAFIEVMPMSLSARDGAPIEEMQQTWRYTAGEVRHLWRYYAEPLQLCYHWAVARAFPFNQNQAQLRDALGIDIPAAGRHKYASSRDDYGWGGAGTTTPQCEIERLTRANLKFYHRALTQPALAPGAVRAIGDMLDFCHARRVPVVLLIPPEASAFRSYAPAVEACHVHAVRRLAHERDVPVVDARTWVDDDGFYDGHHALTKGADQYTRRFAGEALTPHFSRLSSRSGRAVAALP